MRRTNQLLLSFLCLYPVTGHVEEEKTITPVTVPVGQWLDLFDGSSLHGWNILHEDHFELAGEVSVEEGAILMKAGAPYTGITWDGEFPRDFFEVEWSGMRRKHYDIFCGLTVPVNDQYVTYVLGGWGGNVVGLSNVNFMNASDNETTCTENFKQNTWYRFRIRVTPEKIQGWIDEKIQFDLPREGRSFDIYYQLEPNQPLGFFTWNTEGAIKDIRMKRLELDPSSRIAKLSRTGGPSMEPVRGGHGHGFASSLGLVLLAAAIFHPGNRSDWNQRIGEKGPRDSPTLSRIAPCRGTVKVKERSKRPKSFLGHRSRTGKEPVHSMSSQSKVI